jgi:predicted flap endonuclease-1-like 5' DNA nuclease
VSHNPGHGDDVAGADDLTRIGGIGSKIAEKLNAAGVQTYDDLASRSADDIVKLLSDVTGLSTARLDSWRDQARELAATTSAMAAEAPEIPAGSPNNGQHYESFVIRVLLNEDRSIRRTTAQHIRTGAKRHWPGLDHGALPDFIETAIASATPPAKASAEPPTDEARQAEAALTRPGKPQFAPERGTPAQSRPLRRVSSAVASVERTLLRAAEPFTMTITIDLADPASQASRLAYNAVVVARPLTGGPKLTVANSAGLITTTSSTISIDAAGLPPGAYRLDGAVSLREPSSDRPVGLAALAEGLLVQVLPG